MTPQQQKEQFSIAYVRAVAAAARVNIYKLEVDDNSIDIGFASKLVLGNARKLRLEAQLKSSASPHELFAAVRTLIFTGGGAWTRSVPKSMRCD